jgi:diadenosine tetraphosphate (Ap4A) HIT family hydrolase
MPHKDSPLVAVVGCSAIKTAHAAPAREFYRSPLFKAALAYAEARTPHVVVVSAKYDAVRLEQELEPYDMKLSSLRKSDREDWGARAVQKLLHWSRPTPLSPLPTLLLLCGELYADAVLYGAHWHNLPRPQTPMAKMKGVGNRIAWLNAEREKSILNNSQPSQ